MKRIHFYMIIHAIVLAVSALPVLYAIHQQRSGHECKQELVDVTKTEGDLTWTDSELMQVCK